MSRVAKVEFTPYDASVFKALDHAFQLKTFHLPDVVRDAFVIKTTIAIKNIEMATG